MGRQVTTDWTADDIMLAIATTANELPCAEVHPKGAPCVRCNPRIDGEYRLGPDYGMVRIARATRMTDRHLRRMSRSERSASTGPQRWYERRDPERLVYLNPLGRLWWTHLYYRLSDPIYDGLWHAGLLDVEPGALWSSARLVLPWRTRRWPTSDVSLRAWVKSAFLRPTRSA